MQWEKLGEGSFSYFCQLPSPTHSMNKLIGETFFVQSVFVNPDTLVPSNCPG